MFSLQIIPDVKSVPATRRVSRKTSQFLDGVTPVFLTMFLFRLVMQQGRREPGRSSLRSMP